MGQLIAGAAGPDRDEFMELAHAVERQVQQAAAQAQLAYTNNTDQQRVLQLISEAIASLWSVAQSSKDLDQGRRLASYVARSMLGAGPLQPLLSRHDVTEIMVNAPDRIFLQRTNGRVTQHSEAFYNDAHVRRILERLIDSAVGTTRVLDPQEGVQDISLRDGSRLHIVHPELSRGHHFILNIRRFTKSPHIQATSGATDLLETLVRAGATVVIAGLPGTGKTTLLRMILESLDPTTRIVLAEEVLETRVDLPNVAHLQTRHLRPQSTGIDLRSLVGAFLRMAPQRAVVGEVRDKEALAFIMTVTSGVPGLTTIHARDARGALVRLRLLAELAAERAPSDTLTQLISEGVDLVVHTARIGNSFSIDEIAAVEDPIETDRGWTFVTTPLLSAHQPLFGPTWALPPSLRLIHRFPELDEPLRTMPAAG
ncbi:MAG: CpaF family protein [Ferrimicrobium sp.]